jgi:hypothetical protein
MITKRMRAKIFHRRAVALRDVHEHCCHVVLLSGAPWSEQRG